MSELEKKAKTPFEVWQQTVLEALKNLPKAFNTGELSDEISRIRKRKEWIKIVDAQKEMEQLKHKLQQLEFEHTQIDRESGYFISNPQQDFNSFLSWITKKFEELLLKELKNHECEKKRLNRK